MSVDEAMNAVLRSNPKARRVRPNAVNVAPGVDVIYGPVTAPANVAAGSAAAPASTPQSNYCYAYYLCFWEDTISDGWGYGLAFYYCQPPGTVVDLNTYEYPSGNQVGPGPASQRWNDRVSAYENAQSTGTTSHFYNWLGYDALVRNSTAFDGYYDLTAIGINDIIDHVFVCPQ